MGYKVAMLGMRLLGVERPHDEELVAIVENDTCAVDAIQMVTGCTFGKGNLVFRDYGKGAVSFLSRKRKNGVRIRYRRFPALSEPEQCRIEAIREKMRSESSVSEQERQEYDKLRQKLIDTILHCEPEDLLEWRTLENEPPPPAQIHQSVVCQRCGEEVMDTRVVKIDGKPACIPCSRDAT
jgi:formylmethanofuran dehydrogenase subunit E